MIENGKSMSYISDLYGFSSQAYYSQTFKRIVGITPIQYKKDTTRKIKSGTTVKRRCKNCFYIFFLSLYIIGIFSPLKHTHSKFLLPSFNISPVGINMARCCQKDSARNLSAYFRPHRKQYPAIKSTTRLASSGSSAPDVNNYRIVFVSIHRQPLSNY